MVRRVSSSVCPARAEFLHVKPGKGAAFVRTKLKNYITGNVVERTFRGGESVDSATLDKKETQFSYVDGDDVSASPVCATLSFCTVSALRQQSCRNACSSCLLYVEGTATAGACAHP